MCPPVEDTPANGTNGHANGNGTNGEHPGFSAIPAPHNPKSHHKSPYQPVGDFLSNIGNFKIIESTLREGEQFAKYVGPSAVRARR
jgi:homocitrate synthase